MRQPSSSPSNYWTVTTVFGGVVIITAAAGLWHRLQKVNSNRRKSSSTVDDSSSTTVSVEGSVMATLPTWAISSSPQYFSKTYTSDEEMMSLAVHLSDRNIVEGTGGPFGAAIFERHTTSEGSSYCTLVAIGMNRVVPLGNSTLHGEMLAIQLAQRKIGSFTLMVDHDHHEDQHHDASGGIWLEGSKSSDEVDNTHEGKEENNATKQQQQQQQEEKKKRQFELFTSCEPCAMCLGATLWSGVSRIVCGATKDDAQSIGFDEGPVYASSYEHLEQCGVGVTRNVLREEAASVLRRYGNSGLIYNRG